MRPSVLTVLILEGSAPGMLEVGSERAQGHSQMSCEIVGQWIASPPVIATSHRCTFTSRSDFVLARFELQMVRSDSTIISLAESIWSYETDGWIWPAQLS